MDQLCTAVRYQAMLAIAALRYKPSPWFCHCTPRDDPGCPDRSREASPTWAGRPSALPCSGLLQRWEEALKLPAGSLSLPQSSGGTFPLAREAPWRRCLPAGLHVPPREPCPGQDLFHPCLSTQALLPTQGLSVCSEVKAIAQEEILPLLNACFKAVFYLPPEEDLDIHLYSHVCIGDWRSHTSELFMPRDYQ